MDLGLAERVYVITGATRGLGLATAKALVAEGARVVVSSRSQEHVEACVQGLGDAAQGVVGDNADPALAPALVSAAQRAFGRLDGALISVGGPPAASVLATTDDQWRSAFETVFLGAVRVARVVGSALEAGGSLVFVLSTSVKQPLDGLAISNGLRPGLAMVAKTLADELGQGGVRVNGVLPGRVDTDRVRELDAATGNAVDAKAARLRGIPMGRYGEPAEFARLATFLLSPASAYVTGAMIPVDGGITRGL